LIAGHSVFFPAATVYSILVLPASLLAFPSGHAHEMLFGFALAASCWSAAFVLLLVLLVRAR